MQTFHSDGTLLVYLAANIGALGTLALIYGRILAASPLDSPVQQLKIAGAFAAVSLLMLVFAQPHALMGSDAGLLAAAVAGPVAGPAVGVWLALLGGGARFILIDPIGATAFTSTALFGAELALLRHRPTISSWIAAGLFAGLMATLRLPGLDVVQYGLFLGTLLSTFLVARLLTHERERVELLHSLRTSATTDPLTHAANRAGIEAASRAAFADCARDNRACAVVYLDLDHFKDINDRFGHPVGDLVLSTAAARIRACLRPNDLFGRPGGEEFVVVLPGCDHAAAARLAERLRQQLVDINPASLGLDRPITGSFGVGAAPGNGTDYDAVMTAADHACLAAKKQGRNCVVTSSELAPAAPDIARPAA